MTQKNTHFLKFFHVEKKHPLLKLTFLILIIFSSCKDNSTGTMTEEQLIAKAKGIHERVITLDTHCDINIQNFTDSINYTQNLESQVNLPKMHEGGLDVSLVYCLYRTRFT